MTKNNKETIIRFLGLLKAYRGRIVLLMLAILLSVGLSLVSPMLSRKLMDQGLMQGDLAVIIKVSLLIFLLRQGSSLLSVWIERKRLRVVYDFRYQMEKQAVEHLLAVKTDYFRQASQAELLNQIDVDVNYICSILNTNTLSIIASVLTIVGGLAAAVSIEGKMVLLILAALPLKYWVIHVHSKVQKKRLNIFLEKNMAYARWFGELVAGMTDIRIYGMEKKKMGEFAGHNGEKIAAHKDMDAVAQYRQLADGTLDALLNLVVFVLGGFFIARGEMTVGSLYAFISYGTYILSPLSSVMNLRVVLNSVLPSATRFFEFLDQKEEGGEVAGKEDAFPELAPEIECRDIFFHHGAQEEEKDVLHGFCLHIPPGEKLALIGRNGCGKTTLVCLLLRLYDCKKGCIRLGGMDISKLGLREYRKLFSVVSQQIYLFNDTLRNNICMCREFEDSAVYAVLEEVGLGELAKERGLDFVVGINGSCLSGGQKQKVALARALLHDRPVFILDEATSNTDIDFELCFRKMLRGRLAHKTILLITHNAELLKEVDQIAFMDEGKLLCTGTYGDLVKENKAFAGLMEQYASAN